MVRNTGKIEAQCSVGAIVVTVALAYYTKAPYGTYIIVVCSVARQRPTSLVDAVSTPTAVVLTSGDATLRTWRMPCVLTALLAWMSCLQFSFFSLLFFIFIFHISIFPKRKRKKSCLLYTSDAADE